MSLPDELYVPTWLKAKQDLLAALPGPVAADVIRRLHGRWLDGEDFGDNAVDLVIERVRGGESPLRAVAATSAAADRVGGTYSAP